MPSLPLKIKVPAYAFRAYPAAYFQGFQTAVTQGVIRFDPRPQKRGSKCVETDKKARTGGQYPGRSCPGF